MLSSCLHLCIKNSRGLNVPRLFFFVYCAPIIAPHIENASVKPFSRVVSFFTWYISVICEVLCPRISATSFDVRDIIVPSGCLTPFTRIERSTIDRPWIYVHVRKTKPFSQFRFVNIKLFRYSNV